MFVLLTLIFRDLFCREICSCDKHLTKAEHLLLLVGRHAFLKDLSDLYVGPEKDNSQTYLILVGLIWVTISVLLKCHKIVIVVTKVLT